MGKQSDGSASQAKDRLSSLTNRGSRRGFLATLGAALGGELVLLTAPDPGQDREA